jgi:hypothetical protein
MSRVKLLDLPYEQRQQYSQWLDEAMAMRQFDEHFRRRTFFDYWLEGVSPWRAVWDYRAKRTARVGLALEA